MTDDTPATPETEQESQTDLSAAGTRLDPDGAAQSAISSAAPQRAAAVTAPLSAPEPDERDQAHYAEGAVNTSANGATPDAPVAEEAALTEVISAEEAAPAEEVAPEVVAPTFAEEAAPTEKEAAPEVVAPAAEVEVAPEAVAPTEAVTAEDAAPTVAEEEASEAVSAAEVESPTAEDATLAEPQTLESVEAPAAPVAPTVDREREAEFARYYAVRTHIGPIAFSPDLTQVAYITNTSGQFNIWRQSVLGGWPSQVTTLRRSRRAR